MSELAYRHVTPDQAELLLKVAKRYYFEQRSKVEIAGELGISRFRVARLLEEGIARGAVRITLHRPRERESQLSAQLKARYGLQHAIVVNSGNLSEPRLREALGRAGAKLLAGLLTDGDVLGVGWGRTVKAVAEAASDLPRCPVVQLSGIAGHPGENSMELVRIFSGLTGESAYPLYTPLLVPDAATAASLRRSPGVAETFGRFRDVSVALVAIGSWNPPNSQLRTLFSAQEKEMLAESGLQAEVGGVLLDAQGQEIVTRLSAQIMGITGPELAAIPTVIAVAGHVTKARAIRSVLLSGFVNALVTDSAVARVLLEEDHSSLLI
ncbi:sugar-binding transcriptional regulator [Actinotalea sp. K2]|uniref:sugar-binding transcriptional regulator n=1 Tax=Actinotalea sp. K2 TaxID=2939438 RepID=UPI002016B6F7|nr:sugar-binding domain-containing protein [Actinotalea sp. K2]MCL3862077.1 transcriptional regulator [Actinotalea sp. K2]